MTLKTYCEQNQLDPEKVLSFVIGQGGSILPQRVGMQGYIGVLTDTSIVFENDVLQVKKEVPYTCFKEAEFGVGSGQLWLQCVVDESPFVFCLRRKDWKSVQGQLLLQKIGEQTEILGMKEYNGYTGKLFLLYMFK